MTANLNDDDGDDNNGVCVAFNHSGRIGSHLGSLGSELAPVLGASAALTGEKPTIGT